jgi:hypothetical protein
MAAIVPTTTAGFPSRRLGLRPDGSTASRQPALELATREARNNYDGVHPPARAVPAGRPPRPGHPDLPARRPHVPPIKWTVSPVATSRPGLSHESLIDGRGERGPSRLFGLREI